MGNISIKLPDKDREYWTKEVSRIVGGKRISEPSAASINIIDGLGFGVTKEGFTVCIGPVDVTGNPLPDGHQTAQDGENPCNIINSDRLPMADDSQIQDNGIMLHRKRGRPLKPDDEICRMTRWRRQQKEKQGLLFSD